MDSDELLKIVARDEDGKHQFKADITNANALAAEMVAFSNSGGGQIFIAFHTKKDHRDRPLCGVRPPWPCF